MSFSARFMSEGFGAGRRPGVGALIAVPWQAFELCRRKGEQLPVNSYALEPVGFIRSTVQGRADALRHGPEGAPDAWLEIEPPFAEALLGMEVLHGESVLWRIGHELIVITWFHEADSESVHEQAAACRRTIRVATREPSAHRMPVRLGPSTPAHRHDRTRSACIQ
jgi:hypothetical protein